MKFSIIYLDNADNLPSFSLYTSCSVEILSKKDSIDYALF